MKRILRIVLTLLLFPAVGATAQIGVYGQFSAGELNVPNKKWIYGPTVGAYFAQQHFAVLSTGIDLRGTFLGNGGSTVLNSGLAGLRLGFKPHILPIQPYVEGLVGVGHADYVYYLGSVPIGTVSDTKFEYQFLGGLDLTVLPHIDWRLIEFSYGALPGLSNSLDPKTLSMGLVVRLR